MDKYTIIKNGLVLTLDRKGQAGYFNIIIKNGKIFLIDYEKRFNEKEFRSKNPDSLIIDATDKLIMPGFFNSKLVSSYTINKIFFKKCNYQNITSWLSLRLIDKYLSGIENAELLKDLLKISYLRSLYSGEVFINESSHVIGKDFFDIYFTDFDWVDQYYNLTSYDLRIPPGSEGRISFGFNNDENLTNYTLSSIKRDLSGNKSRIFIEASLSENAFDSIKKVFGRSFISVLAEMDMISSNTIISNPTHISPFEFDLLKKKNATILICPSDYVNFSDRKLDPDDIISSGINLIIGTGYTGTDILSELKLFSTLVSKNLYSYENILQASILNPSFVFGVSNVTGIIERNRSADLIFFDLKDIRNTLSLPETDRDNLCEFVIQNLTSKDISDVMLKGKMVIKDRSEQLGRSANVRARSEEISQKIYSAGKYFEYKEKYLMRGRVDRLSLDNAEGEDAETKEDIFVDMTETGDYTGDGEFSIIGKKEEEFEKPRERDKETPGGQINLQEIKSLDKDLNLFEGIESAPDTKKQKKPGKKISKEANKPVEFKEEKITFDDVNTEEIPEAEFGIKEETAIDDKAGSTGSDSKPVHEEIKIDPEYKKQKDLAGEEESYGSKKVPEKTETEKPMEATISLPKKTKLKFGFKDGE